MNGMYRVNDVARRYNEQPTRSTVLPATRPNGVRLRPPLLPPRQTSTTSTRSYVSARSSTTSFKWNIAYFLLKILGSPGDTESPVEPPEPSDQAQVTTFESRDQVERYDTDDQGPTAAVHVNATTEHNGVGSPHYVNITDYELVESGEQGTQGDRNEKPTADFSDGEYLRVLS